MQKSLIAFPLFIGACLIIYKFVSIIPYWPYVVGAFFLWLAMKPGK